MFAYIEPPNQRIKIITNLLKILCVCTTIMGLFRLTSQRFDVSSILYFISAFLYVISWRSLSYYYCLINKIVNLSIILNLLTEVFLRQFRWQTCCTVVSIRPIYPQLAYSRWSASSSPLSPSISISFPTNISNPWPWKSMSMSINKKTVNKNRNDEKGMIFIEINKNYKLNRSFFRLWFLFNISTLLIFWFFCLDY